MINKIKKFTLRIVVPILILFLFQYIGILINTYLLKLIPGSIIGMLLLLAALKLKIIPYELMKNFSDFLIKHISFFLIPTTVSIISIMVIEKNELPFILVALLISLIVVLTAVGYFVVFMTKSNEAKDYEEE